MSNNELTEQNVKAHCDEPVAASISSLNVFSEIDSTNTWLSGQPIPEAGKTSIAVADTQSAGRGRGGKTWELPASAGLCLSILRQPPQSPQSLAPLSLVVGLEVCRFLRSVGVTTASVKWPNDIVAGEHKVAGILTELPGPDRLIIGIGLNIDLPEGFTVAREPGALPAGDLVSAGLERGFARAKIAGGLVAALVRACDAFESETTARLLRDWDQSDYLKGKRVSCGDNVERICGIARGVADDGTLRIEIESGAIAPVAGGTIRLAAAS